MSTLETKKIEPLSGTSVTLGAAGDAVTMPAGVTVKTNTVKDAGGNTLWTSDGSGTLSSVNSALQGNMIFISSQTASSSASLSFTSGIDSTYDEYVFYFVNINPASDGTNFTFQVSTNGGSSYGITITSSMFVATVGENGSNGRIEYVTAGDLAQSTSYQPLGLYVGSAADECISGELHLFTPSNTTYVKHFYATGNLVSSSVYTRNPYVAGYVNSTSDVDAIDFKMASGNINAGTIYLYGIK